MARVFATVTSVVLTVAYPLAVYWALTHWSARAVGLIAIAIAVPLFAFRFQRADRGHLLAVLRVPLLVMALLLLGAIFDDQRFVLALPVLISGVLLVTFGSSLAGEMTIIERFARLRDGDLTLAKVRHCRQVTWVWCGFFLVNGAIAGVLALLEMREAWAIYAGGVAYALMGLLVAGEWIIRRIRFGGPSEALAQGSET